MREELLSGGRMTLGVVRIGDTVRRPPCGNAEFARGLLDHLALRGFAGAPRYLGVDDAGRQCFTYIDGIVPSELSFHDDAVLCAAARLIRTFHDATSDFTAESEIVCHNDLSPCNFVFVAGSPIALIDFDAAAPGTRLSDLGYAAWLWLDIGNEEVTVLEQLRRLRLFAREYDPDLSVDELIGAMLLRQRLLASEEDVARSAWAAACHAWTRYELLPALPTVARGNP